MRTVSFKFRFRKPYKERIIKVWEKACKGLAAVCLCLSASVLAGCDGHHEPLDTSMKAGHILCIGGESMSYEEYAASGKEAIGVVFYVNHNEDLSGTGYAVYLHDLTAETFADSLGVAQGTSQAWLSA